MVEFIQFCQLAAAKVEMQGFKVMRSAYGQDFIVITADLKRSYLVFDIEGGLGLLFLTQEDCQNCLFYRVDLALFFIQNFSRFCEKKIT